MHVCMYVGLNCKCILLRIFQLCHCWHEGLGASCHCSLNNLASTCKVQNKNRKYDSWSVPCCRCLISAQTEPEQRTVLVTCQEVERVSFRLWYFRSSARASYSHMGHCLSGMSSATLSLQTRTYRHRSSVCQCITLRSLRHRVHIYSFITTLSFVWGREKNKKPSTRLPFLHDPEGLGCSCTRLPVCLTSNPVAAPSKTKLEITAGNDTANGIQAHHLSIYKWP